MFRTLCVMYTRLCIKVQVSFPLLLNKVVKWGQEACIRLSYQLDFVGEGHVQSGQVRFLLLLNKALKYGQGS